MAFFFHPLLPRIVSTSEKPHRLLLACVLNRAGRMDERLEVSEFLKGDILPPKPDIARTHETLLGITPGEQAWAYS